METDKLAVRQFTQLFDALKNDSSASASTRRCTADDPEQYLAMVEKTFVARLTWSVGASLDDESRKKFDTFVSDLDSAPGRRTPCTDTS